MELVFRHFKILFQSWARQDKLQKEKYSNLRHDSYHVMMTLAAHLPRSVFSFRLFGEKLDPHCRIIAWETVIADDIIIF